MNFEEKRQKVIAKIPSWYNPFLHAIIPSLLGIILIACCSFAISNLSLGSLIFTPIITLFFLFAFEWFAHKNVLHRRQKYLGSIFELHTLAHHVMYTDRQMALQDKRELYYILMPPYAILLVFILVAPLAFGLGLIFSLNVACLILITSMIFFLMYEWLHFCYHQPANSLIGRNRTIRFLRRLHRRHHDPTLMRSWNFNVTFPVFDLIMGTYWRRHEQ